MKWEWVSGLGIFVCPACDDCVKSLNNNIYRATGLQGPLTKKTHKYQNAHKFRQVPLIS